MKIILPMLIMLIAGLALGGGSATLMWSRMLSRSLSGQAEWSQIASKFEAIAKTNQAGWNECLTLAEAAYKAR